MTKIKYNTVIKTLEVKICKDVKNKMVLCDVYRDNYFTKFCSIFRELTVSDFRYYDYSYYGYCWWDCVSHKLVSY